MNRREFFARIFGLAIVAPSLPKLVAESAEAPHVVQVASDSRPAAIHLYRATPGATYSYKRIVWPALYDFKVED